MIIEEAQSVLGRRLEETSPFVEWVKEGRKYDLGAIMITQQPGSMAPENNESIRQLVQLSSII